jgi:tetratricopeptide (TPR) repeat protein
MVRRMSLVYFRFCVIAIFMAISIFDGIWAIGAEPPEVDSAAKEWKKCWPIVIAAKLESDYDMARSYLKRFIIRFPESPKCAEAKKQLALIEPAAEQQIERLFKKGKVCSSRGQYDLALEVYTEVLTRSPNPEKVRKARQAIVRNDAATKPLFDALKKKSDALFASWKFADAAESCHKAAKALCGTKWEDPTLRMFRESSAVRDLISSLNSKIKAKPKKTPFRVPNIDGWKVRAQLAKVVEEGVLCYAEGAGKVLKWDDLLPAGGTDVPTKFLQIFELYQFNSKEYLALSIILLRRGAKKSAEVELQKIIKDQKVGTSARRYLTMIVGSSARMTYDFSSGLQLMDWRAKGGRWRIVKGELVQETKKGEGELALTKGKIKLKSLRFFCEINSISGGLISVVFKQDESNSFGWVISPGRGYSAYARINGEVTTVKDENFRLPKGPLVIRSGINKDSFIIKANGKKLPYLSAKGLASLEGSLFLKTFDCSAKFDNIVVGNKK